MEPMTRKQRIERYKDLLCLALAQIQAIDIYDQAKLNRIVEQKWAIIRSLSGTSDLIKDEPGLAETIKKIQEADRIAEQKLTAGMGRIRTRLCQMNKQHAAKQAYGQASRKRHPIMGLAIDDNTPRFFDIQS